MLKKRAGLSGFAICLLIFGLSGINAKADTSFNTYLYDEWDDSVKAPASYDAVKSVNGLQMDSGAWSVPEDFCMDDAGNLYIADTGNERILILDEELCLKKTIETVGYGGEDIPLTDVEGIYVAENGLMYVCQTSLGRVLEIKGGEVIGEISKPVSNLIADDFVFAPTKVGIDIYGRAYVLSKGCYTGFLQYDANHDFMGFYGANKVEVTGEVLIKRVWKSILSDEQRAAMTSIIPIEYSNIDCSKDGFVYTSTVGTKIPKNQIKKLNPLGTNIYYTVGKEEFNFGDEEMTYVQGKAIQPAFTDVEVNENGLIFATDLTTGRVFERDQEGNLIAVFGGLGNQLGTFQTPVAIECYDGKIYVLDRLKGNITVFERTEYGKLTEEALALYDGGDYASSMIIWEEVLKKNSNSMLAYTEMGKALSQCGRYDEALEYLRYSGDKYSYSKAFAKRRLSWMKEYGMFILIPLLIAPVAFYFISNSKKKKLRASDDEPVKKKTDATNPLYTILHPFDASYDIRFKNKGSLLVSAGILFAGFLISIFSRQNTGYIFNDNKLSELNVFLQFVVIALPFALFVFGNWIVAILMNGTGRLRDIVIYGSYCLIPFFACQFVGVLLSNVLAKDEPFGTYVVVFGLVWSLIIIFIGLMTMHEFKFTTAVFHFLCTVFVMFILLFLIMLIGSLASDLYTFVGTLIKEVGFRVS